MNQKASFPSIMGIVNVTPDSFSDGGMFFDSAKAIDHGLRLLDDGADLLDVGGESTRPGASPTTAQDEIGRVVPVIRGILALRPEARISIDTMKSTVAHAAMQAGATMINDVSGLLHDIKIAEVAAQNKIPLVVMHIQGNPSTMQVAPKYRDVIQEIKSDLYQKARLAQSLGVAQVFIDPGIGFGKTFDHNWTILANIDAFGTLGFPVVLGLSRKAFIGNILGIDIPSGRDCASTLVHCMLLGRNISMVRVHNVEQMRELRVLHARLEQG